MAAAACDDLVLSCSRCSWPASISPIRRCQPWRCRVASAAPLPPGWCLIFSSSFVLPAPCHPPSSLRICTSRRTPGPSSMAWRVPGDDVLSRCNFGAEAGRRAAQASSGFFLFFIKRVDAQSRKSHPQRGIPMYVPYVCNKHHQDCDLQVSSPPRVKPGWSPATLPVGPRHACIHPAPAATRARISDTGFLSRSLAFSSSESPDAIP